MMIINTVRKAGSVYFRVLTKASPRTGTNYRKSVRITVDLPRYKSDISGKYHRNELS